MAAWVRSAKFSCKSAELSCHFPKPRRVQQKVGNGVFIQAFYRSEVMSALPLRPLAILQAYEDHLRLHVIQVRVMSLAALDLN